MKYPRLSPEDEKAFLDALWSIWDAIANDALGNDYKKTIPRSHVICMVTDQFCSYGHNFTMPKEQHTRIREWMMKTSSRVVDQVAAKKFTYPRWGL